MRTVEIKVTKQHIELGIPGSCNYCPIARAVIPHISAKTSAFVPGAVVVFSPLSSFTLSLKNISVKLPAEARRFVKKFDKGEPVRPFKFKLKIPSFTDLMKVKGK